MFDLFREIAQTLKHNKLRTALTGFAVAWGIFMLIVLLSLANGLINSFEANMMGRDSNSMTVWGGVTARSWKGYKDGRSIDLLDRDMQAVADADENHISNVSASLQLDATTFSTPKDYFSGSADGVFPSVKEVQGIEIVAGRFINDNDIREKRKSIVINKEYAETLFGSAEDAVGKRLDAMSLSWTVVGVYRHDFRRSTYIPFTTARLISGNKNEVDALTVNVENLSSLEDGEQIEQTVRSAVAKNHDFDPDDDSAVWIWNRFSQRMQTQSVMQVLVLTMWVIGILTLLSGIIGVSNIMFVSVKERTHEIGIRRAIGARRRSILLQVVAESVAITTIAGYVGIVLGTIVMALVDTALGESIEMLRHPSVDLKVAVQVTVILIVAGALAGFFPALKATKVKPVEALRDE